MTKSTAAVILVSPSKLPPWGDDGWRFAGAMQLVADGPDWLYAQWPSLSGPDDQREPEQFSTFVLRDEVDKRAADIALMTFALIGIPEWQRFASWWNSTTSRDVLEGEFRSLAERYAGTYKLAVVHTADPMPAALIEAIRSYGFAVVEFSANGPHDSALCD